MANKKIKSNSNQKNTKKRADKKTAPKNNKFNFDNEIVIGVNVVPQKQKDKPLSNRNIKKKKSNKKVNLDNKKETNKKRNNKNNEIPKKVNIKKILKSIFLIVVILGVIVFIMTTPIFNITEIKVQGNNRISEERIESLSKISLNVNTYQYSKKNIIDNIKEEPYIESVQIKRKLPSIIIIDIKERNRNFVISNLGSYIYIDKQGYILEITNEAEKLPEIKGLSSNIENLIPGNRVYEADLEKINTIDKIMEAINNNKIESEVTCFDISSDNEFCIIMQNENKKVHLGNESNINDKVLMLKEILTKEKGKTGEIFIENLEKVFFREASWIE